jgi:IMP dehydrogenase
MAHTIHNNPSTTFSEYILFPGLQTKRHTADSVVLRTPLTRFANKKKPAITLNIPFSSACMQAVSGHELAISLARQGGIGFIYCSQPIDEQAEMVHRVKDFKAGFVVSKANLTLEHRLSDAIELTKKTGFSTICITRDGSYDSELLGILTDQDYWLDYDDPDTPVGKLMTPFSDLKYGIEGIDLDSANAILRQSKKSCIPIVNSEGERKLVYLVFKKDRETHREFPNELIDPDKKLICGAGINTRDYPQRVPALVSFGVDALVIDTSDGYNEFVKDTISWVKDNYPDVPIGAGNVVEKEGFLYLAEAGADFVKVGIGGGSICITQEVKGIGRGQASALMDVVEARNDYLKKTGAYIPICSDGGLVQDSHILIALAFGADFVMMGRYFARCEESPPEKRINVGSGLVKPYWGEGSMRAKNWQRYHESGGKLTFEEGVDGFVPYAGYLSDVVGNSMTVIGSTMCNLGCSNIPDLHKNATLQRRSLASMREGKPHDVELRSDSLGSYSQLFWGK